MRTRSRGPRIRAARAAGSVAPLADGTTERRLTPAVRAARPARWEEIRASVAATDAQGYAAAAEATSTVSHVARLTGLAVPALLLCGEDDQAVPPAEGERVARLLPDVRFHAIAGARRLPNVERADLFGPLLLEWVARFG